MADRPIDRIRDSAASMEIGTEQDGAITGFASFNDRLLVVKERAVYETLMADTIDPDRTNPAIPNSQQRLLGIGSNSPLVGRTLLTAEEFLKPGFLADVNCDAAKEAAFRICVDLEVMLGDVDGLAAEVEANRAAGVGAKLSQGFSIPVVPGMESRCNAFFQRAHHVVKSLMDIARVFFGPVITHPDSLLAHVKSKFPEAAPVHEFLDQATPHLRFVWLARNAIEHPKPVDRLVVSNFALGPDGELTAPSIELVHPSAPLPRTQAASLLADVTEALAQDAELLIALLSLSRARFGHFPLAIMAVPPERRRSPHVGYSYATLLNGEWHPLG